MRYNQIGYLFTCAHEGGPSSVFFRESRAIVSICDTAKRRLWHQEIREFVIFMQNFIVVVFALISRSHLPD